jgi:hypothetical protein
MTSVSLIFVIVGLQAVQPFSGFLKRPKVRRVHMAESILDSSAQQLQSAEAKVTYLGEQTKPIGTVIFCSKGYKPALEHFPAVQRSRHTYTNDTSRYTQEFAVEPDEFQRMLTAVKPVLKASETYSGPEFLSFAVLRQTMNGIEGREFHIAPSTAKDFYTKLIGAMEANNIKGRKALGRQFAAVCP